MGRLPVTEGSSSWDGGGGALTGRFQGRGDRKLATQVLGRAVHLALRLAQLLDIRLLSGASGEERTEGLRVSCFICQREWSNAPNCSVPPARSGLQRVTPSVSAHPAELHYNSRNAPRGGQTDALPPPERLIEAFLIPAVCPQPTPHLNFWGF